MKSQLYYEAHVTIDPVPEIERDYVAELAKPFGFKLAKLLMQKGEPSKLDTFLTGHGDNYADMVRRTVDLCRCLDNMTPHRIRRYKIEDTLLDSRAQGDVLGIMK